MSDASVPDWINAISAAMGAVAVIVGLFGANSKINEAQRTARELRRSQVAEELIALAHNAEDAFRDIRNPFDSIPADKAHDERYAYQMRFERIGKYDELFRRLREAQIRVRAVVGNEAVDVATSDLFAARNQVAIALKTLAEYVEDPPTAPSEHDRRFKVKLRGEIWGSFNENDLLGKQIIRSVETIERELNPIARLEANK
ncbi:hypothetical protein [Rhodobacter maris]|uniref:hypothetical protein n=1 Tax=Rhodobacter maris TaxID=446682 RepID=UPI0011411139|nr:hypothetical protein [Rhodobacter maris]